MRMFAIEHSLSEYRADFVFYGGAWLPLLAYLALATPVSMRWAVVSLSMIGIATWSLVEYLLHRFVMHGLRPFKEWHIAHHQHPTALICTPTILSAALMVLLVFLPALVLVDLWHAYGLTFGMLSGYLAYTVTHHTMHHGRAGRSWPKLAARAQAVACAASYGGKQSLRRDQCVLGSCVPLGPHGTALRRKTRMDD